jgi:hypothetical protein
MKSVTRRNRLIKSVVLSGTTPPSGTAYPPKGMILNAKGLHEPFLIKWAHKVESGSRLGRLRHLKMTARHFAKEVSDDCTLPHVVSTETPNSASTCAKTVARDTSDRTRRDLKVNARGHKHAHCASDVLIAVRIYDDGADNWRGEVVLDNEGDLVQIGEDCGSCEKALGLVRVLLAQMKAKDSWLEVTDLKRAA